MKETFCAICGVIGSALVHFLGGIDDVFIALCVFMVVDYATGIVVALVFKNSPKTETGKLNSKASLQGLFKKLFMLILVGVAHTLDMVLGVCFVRSGVVVAFIANETISIIENAGLMGVPIPKVITEAIELLNDGGKKDAK